MFASIAPSGHSLWDPNRFRDVKVPKRTRASKPKVRTGCVTCKQRHVKCDERKPACLRCEKAGATCIGYEPPSPPVEKPSKPKKAPQPVSRVILPKPKSSGQGAAANAVLPKGLSRPNPTASLFNDNEVVYFDLFRYQLINDLSGFCHSNFWSRVVLREGIRDECIRHAILAIGALSQALHYCPEQMARYEPKSPVAARRQCFQSVLNRHHRMALHHHMKATSMFRKRIESERDIISPRTLLVATLLFVAYELIQGNVKAADSLITSGVSLLKGSIKMLSARSSNPQQRTKVDDDMDEVERFLPRLSVNANFTRFGPQQHGSDVPFTPSNFEVEFPDLGLTSLDDALEMWNDFCVRSTVFVHHHARKALHNQLVDAAAARYEQDEFLSRTYRWRTVLQSYESAEELMAKLEPPPAGERDHYRSRLCGIRITRLHNLANIIALSCCLDRTGLAYDAFLTEYRQVVNGCAALLDVNEPHEEQQQDACRTGLSPVLGFIVATCRRLDVRMQAMDYFRRLNWRDGDWGARALAVGNLGLISLEQSGADAEGFIPPASRYHWSDDSCDLESRKLLAEYRRMLPDKSGQPVTVKLLLDM